MKFSAAIAIAVAVVAVASLATVEARPNRVRRAPLADNINVQDNAVGKDAVVAVPAIVNALGRNHGDVDNDQRTGHHVQPNHNIAGH
ncbi:hypothetical protein BDF22DRAFT_672195 [Syncephalis plumigaleata]|nr:hypothetical protein BDF22DRAFT_672195 [Syncephalis plumigaleata]